MEVGILSSQCIKPSCPTPKHLKTHKLSLLDPFMPGVYVPVVLFYTADQSAQAITDSDITAQRLKQLKRSLSETLARFYPFAGRHKDELSIECNDEGVHFTEAKASFTLFECLNQPNLPSFVHKLLPGQPRWQEEIKEGAPVAMVQVTSFACGGMTIGVMVSHLIADGTAASFFLKSWGAISRQQFQSAFPEFNAPFPKIDSCPKYAKAAALFGQLKKKGRLGVRRFLFDATAISKLKAQGSGLTVANPSRVEVVSSLIWKCASAAFKASSGFEGDTLVIQSVNMRRRATPTFPESCMGNFIWIANALMSAKEKVTGLPDLVMKLRETVKAVDSDFVKGLQDEGGLTFLRHCEVLKEIAAGLTSGVNGICYSSWCNFGLYDVDYGWGKPTWVSCFHSPGAVTEFFNVVNLMDTPLRDGIEAWIFFDEDDLTMLQQDKEFLAFAKLDPNPLQLDRSGSHMHYGLP